MNDLTTLKMTYGTDDSGAAMLLGVDKGTISRYRNGKTDLPVRILFAIDALCRLPIAEREQIRRERIK